MKVNSIQSTNFQAKQRFVSAATNNGIKKLLENMNEESIIINKEKAYMLKSLTVDENVLYDNRTAVNQPLKLALFDIGKRNNQLVVDTETGQIVDYYLSLFSTWKGTLKKVSEAVDKMLKNFENERVVKRDYLTVTNM